MTERKPTGMSFRTWIDQQIDDAADRGAFDDLPGAGKPLPRRTDDDDGQAWLLDYLRRQGVSTEVLLPPPLRLRKEAAVLAETAPALRSEQEVRAAVAGLNQRIMEWRRIPVGPPIFVPLVDEDAMVAAWRAAQSAPAPAATPTSARREQPEQAVARPSWWWRRGRQART
jgi:DnaJ homologue, subfamily C, member 28, conserved domain